MNITLPPYAQTVITLLESAGFCAVAVGGCVRDSLLGREPLDWDIATSARPEEVMLALHGLRVLTTGLRHGTVTALVEGDAVEVTSFRLEGAYSDHRRPDSVAFTADLHADLNRRDFTVNAMAWHPVRGLCDPFGGAQDLAEKRLRCVGLPEQRLEEDALRILRALRFCAVLGFSMEEATAQAVLRHREQLRFVAAERLRVELLKLLCGDDARRVLRDFRRVIFVLLPQLQPMEDFAQHNPWHCYDVWQHTCAAVEAAPPAPALRLAALLHDCGKPECFCLDADGVGHFHGHAAASERMARGILTQLRCSRRFTEQVAQLVRLHELRLSETPPGQKRTARLRRLLGELGETTLLELIWLAKADAAAQAPQGLWRLEDCDALAAEVRTLAAEGTCVTRKQLAVNGNDLAALGLQGPALGKALQGLLEDVLEGRAPNERAALLARVAGV
ncbi:MAG: HD domain-containing protein [Oscillospiraceae bacterium]|jgi:tRNA nucleotidyltransferase (CCA-adding enzyme)|nr:HD domain-containing protein [Oscillospiraceae bacterium]